jgi:hypothetical protein
MQIDFTVEQAQKVLDKVKPGSHYYREAQRVLRDSGLMANGIRRTTPRSP